MTRLDFAIHLFSAARQVGSGSAHRVPVVTLLILLHLSRQPDRWISGSQLAAQIASDTLSAGTIATSTRGAVQHGLLEKRLLAGGINGALEWRITPAGQRVVVDLLAPPAATTTTAAEPAAA